jgi:hypothetical protein
MRTFAIHHNVLNAGIDKVSRTGIDDLPPGFPVVIYGIVFDFDLIIRCW